LYRKVTINFDHSYQSCFGWLVGRSGHAAKNERAYVKTFHEAFS